MPKWSPNGHQNSTKMLPKIGLKMLPVPKGPWRCFSPYFGALAPIKMSKFCGRGVKNHMFAHFTVFSWKVPIFTPKFVIFGLQKVSKMLPKTPKNIVPILECFLTLFGAKMTPKSDPKILKISIKRHSEPQSSPQHSTKSSQSPFGLQNEAKMLPI